MCVYIRGIRSNTCIYTATPYRHWRLSDLLLDKPRYIPSTISFRIIDHRLPISIQSSIFSLQSSIFHLLSTIIDSTSQTLLYFGTPYISRRKEGQKVVNLGMSIWDWLESHICDARALLDNVAIWTITKFGRNSNLYRYLMESLTLVRC